MNAENVLQIWDKCLIQFKKRVPPQSYQTWFKPIIPYNFDNNTLFLAIPSPFFYEWIHEHYETILKEILLKEFGKNIKCRFETIVEGIIYEKDYSIISRPPIVIATKKIYEDLVSDLKQNPESIHNIDPYKFEELVAEILENKGYDVQVTPRTNDGGKDIIAGFSTPTGEKCICYVECKKYNQHRPIGVDIVRSLYGTMEYDKVNLAMLVTTSNFTKGALEMEKSLKSLISLKDYRNLQEWIRDYS